MTVWTRDELNRIGSAEEVEIAVLRRGGGVRNRVTVWAVVRDGAVYVRSAVRGRSAAWFRAVQETHKGQIWAGEVTQEVTFADVDHTIDDAIDAAYRTKYRRYTGRILNSVLSPESRSTTIRISPRN